MSAAARKPLGALLIIAFIAVWALAVASFADIIGGWPVLAQAIFYLAAGIGWILPLKPALRWMETGRWRVQPAQASEGRTSDRSEG